MTGYLSRDIDLGRADVIYGREPFVITVPEDCDYSETGPQVYYIPLIRMIATTPTIGSNIMGGGKRDPESCQVQGGEDGMETTTALVGQPKKRRRKQRLIMAVLDRLEEEE